MNYEADKKKWQTGMTGFKSAVKTVLSLEMLFPLNVLRFNIDFGEITLENRFPLIPYFYVFVLEVLSEAGK